MFFFRNKLLSFSTKISSIGWYYSRMRSVSGILYEPTLVSRFMSRLLKGILCYYKLMSYEPFLFFFFIYILLYLDFDMVGFINHSCFFLFWWMMNQCLSLVGELGNFSPKANIPATTPVIIWCPQQCKWILQLSNLIK